MQMVFLDRKGDNAESAFHGTKFPRFQPMRARHTRVSNIVADSEQNSSREKYIRIFSIHTSRRDDSSLLLVFIEHDRVGFNSVPSNDLETCLVGDPVAVPESSRTGMCCPRHIMERGKEKS